MSLTMARLEMRSRRYLRASVRLVKYLVSRVPAERLEGDAEFPGIHGATGIGVTITPDDVVPVLVVDPVAVTGALQILS